MKTVLIAIPVFLFMLSCAARAQEYKVNMIVDNRMAYIDNAGAGLAAGADYDLYSGAEKVGSVAVLGVSQYFASAEILEGRGALREGVAYRFVMRPEPSPRAVKPAAAGKISKSGPALMESEKKGEERERGTGNREPAKETAEDVKEKDRNPERKTTKTGKDKDRKPETGNRKPEEKTAEKGKKNDVPERTGKDKEESEKEKQEEQPAADNNPMINENGTTGLVTIPSALTIGKHRRTARYAYKTSDFTFGLNLAGDINLVKYGRENRLNEISLAYGPGRNSEISFSYAAGRSVFEQNLFGTSDVLTLPFHYERSENKRLTEVNAKYRFDGGRWGRVRAALAAEYTNERTAGDPEDNLFAAAVVDVPIARYTSFITLLYGLDDAGDQNVTVRAAGVTVPVRGGWQFCAEYRQVEYYTQTWTTYGDWKYMSYGLQYRLDEDYSIGANYTKERGGSFDFYDTVESDFLSVYILHHSSGRFLNK